MKKSSKKMSEKTMSEGVVATGIDLSDRTGRFYAIDDEGKRIGEGTTTLRTPELEKRARSIAPTVTAIEAGTHSPWISRLLARCGHEVIVANPVKVALITKNVQKRILRTPSIDIARAPRPSPDADLTDDGLLMEVRRQRLRLVLATFGQNARKSESGGTASAHHIETMLAPLPTR